MATDELNAISLCEKCIDEHKNFVLQGGAGSGKTESLKELLLYIKRIAPQDRVVCITHTNVAVDEILSRVGDKYNVSTIHSFLHGLIKDYKKNIKQVIPELFTVPQMVRSSRTDETSEVDFNKLEHEKYKKIYKKYVDKLYEIKHENCERVTGKRDYDKNPEAYNKALNEKISTLNDVILKLIDARDYSIIRYNETSFNSMCDLSYGHDGLLAIFHILFEKYPVLQKMISDKYDYIFIDEYQDTKSEVIRDLINVAENSNLTIGLFGDSMQSIYNDGIGDVEPFIKMSTLLSIPKPDNYRCSYEIVDVINPLRLDNIKQEVALKRLNNGEIEPEVERHGLVKILYSICESKPNACSSNDDKAEYQNQIDLLIEEAKKHCENPKILMLTNKAIAEKNGFKNLYKVFDDRYVDIHDRIEKYLRSMQALDVCDLCMAYMNKEYNVLIKSIQSGGYVIRNVMNKKLLHDIIQGLIDNKGISIWDAVELAYSKKILKQTEACKNTVKSSKYFIEQLAKDEFYNKFKKLYIDGQNTFNRIKEIINMQSEEEFDYWKLQ